MRKLAAAIAALMLSVAPIAAQPVLQDGTTFTGHYAVSGVPPVGTGCTITAGSTDTDGSCTATAAAGTVAFAKAFVTAPFCVVQDSFGTPVIVYTTTTAQITLTTVTSTHVYFWHCAGRSGN